MKEGHFGTKLTMSETKEAMDFSDCFYKRFLQMVSLKLTFPTLKKVVINKLKSS